MGKHVDLKGTFSTNIPYEGHRFSTTLIHMYLFPLEIWVCYPGEIEFFTLSLLNLCYETKIIKNYKTVSLGVLKLCIFKIIISYFFKYIRGNNKRYVSMSLDLPQNNEGLWSWKIMGFRPFATISYWYFISFSTSYIHSPYTVTQKSTYYMLLCAHDKF